MTITIESSADLYERLTSHLRLRPEQIAFLVADEIRGGSDTRLAVRDLLLLQPRGVAHDDWHVLLTDGDQKRVLDWAFNQDGWLIETHSHIGWLGDPARMSHTDLVGLESWVPHVRWRLQRRGYAALVFGNRTFDGIGWSGPLKSAPQLVSEWTTPNQTYPATQDTLSLLEDTDA
jgi:hypothetical protein